MTSEVASSIIGRVDSQWLTPDSELSSYAVDGLIPTMGVRPSTVEDLSEVVSIANEEGLATIPLGGRTQCSLGNPPRRYDLALDMQGLDRLVQHEPSDLTVTVEAGMSLSELDEILAAEGQFLPLEVPRPVETTVGGMLAAASSGPLSMTYGFPRDWLIGVKVVNADGRVTKGGGRVVKNVTGYDMNKLYTGSLGTLGVIVEASFKVSPRPSTSTTLTAAFDSLYGAMEGAWALLKGYGGPDALILSNGPIAERLGLGVAEFVLLTRFLGRGAVVKGRVERAKASVRSAGADEINELGGDEASTWQSLVDMPWTDEVAQMLGVRCSVLPTEVGRLLENLEQIKSWNLNHGLVANVGTGLVRSLSWGDAAPSEYDLRVQRVIRQMTEQRSAWVVEHCTPFLKKGRDVWGPLPSGLGIMRRLKLALDPHGILSPGRFVGGI